MSKNILDSRNLEERFNELLAEYQEWLTNLSPEDKQEIAEKWGDEFSSLTEDDKLEEWQLSTDEGEEHKQISLLKDEQIYDWDNGVTFVKDSYFETFAEDEADQLGLVENKQWPYDCIDWEKAANRLQMDYSSVEFDGETYWYRDC